MTEVRVESKRRRREREREGGRREEKTKRRGGGGRSLIAYFRPITDTFQHELRNSKHAEKYSTLHVDCCKLNGKIFGSDKKEGNEKRKEKKVNDRHVGMTSRHFRGVFCVQSTKILLIASHTKISILQVLFFPP